MPGKAVVIALGGNAILRHRETGRVYRLVPASEP